MISGTEPHQENSQCVCMCARRLEHLKQHMIVEGYPIPGLVSFFHLACTPK